jgi:hypothetical protein
MHRTAAAEKIVAFHLLKRCDARTKGEVDIKVRQML